MNTKPQRDPSTGPYILAGESDRFRAFCSANGHDTIDHPDPFRVGFMVRNQGQWMSVLYNKTTKRYTADHRLSLLVQSFASMKKSTLTLTR